MNSPARPGTQLVKRLTEVNALKIPEHLRHRLPDPSIDGHIYADVQFRGKWEGIVVIDESHEIIGVSFARKVTSWPLPFTDAEIEDFRKPCLWNRFLAGFPESCNPWTVALVAIWLVAPCSIIAGFLITPWLHLLPIPLFFFAVRVLYSARGFLFIRFPTATFAFYCALWGAWLFLLNR